MDDAGNYTDKRGRELAVGTHVIMAVDDYVTGAVGAGIIMALPPAGHDYHGFPQVQFEPDGSRHYVPAVRLLVNDTTLITLVNQYGKFVATPEAVELMIERHLPASPDGLREKCCEVYMPLRDRLTPVHGFENVRTVAEFLIILAHAEDDAIRDTITV